jgi:hypothetical protein
LTSRITKSFLAAILVEYNMNVVNVSKFKDEMYELIYNELSATHLKVPKAVRDYLWHSELFTFRFMTGLCHSKSLTEHSAALIWGSEELSFLSNRN